MSNKRAVFVCLAMVVMVAITVPAYRFVFARPSFDADKVAQAETKMWQAYYAGEKTQLAIQLVTLLRNQYGMSLLEAKQAGELYAQAAMQFRSARTNYHTVGLEQLTDAYTIIKQTSGARFDPKEAARAELGWWIARRTPGQNAPEQVGAKIGELYAILYGSADPAFIEAGILRAQAGHLRDTSAKNPDWHEVQRLLTDSYSILAGFTE